MLKNRLNFIRLLVVFSLILLISQKQGGFVTNGSNSTFAALNSVSTSNYKVTIERIYVADDKDKDAAGPADVFLVVFKDNGFLQNYGDPTVGEYKINSNGFKQMNLDIYTSTLSGTAPSINITVIVRDTDSGGTYAELGTVEYIIPSLSEGEFHRYEGESADQNIKIWFMTTFGGEPDINKFSSSFVLETIQILDDTDNDNAGDIRLEVLFNGMPLGSKFYPTTSPYQWQIETGNYYSLNIDLTADLITANYVPYTHVIIMVWDQDQDFWGTKYYVSLGYVEINLTTVFSFTNNEFTTVIPGTSGKAKLFISASMSQLPSSTSTTSPQTTTSSSSTTTIPPSTTTTYIALIGNVLPSDSNGKSEDEGNITWLEIIPLGDIGSLKFNYSIVASLKHAPIYGIQPGDIITIETKISKRHSYLTLFLSNLEDPLVEILGQELASLVSSALEGSYPIPLDISFGLNRYIIDETLDLIFDKYRIVITLDVIVTLNMQLGVAGSVEFSSSDLITYTDYSTKSLKLKILETAAKNDLIVIKSAYGVLVNNIILDYEITQLSNQNQESERILETGPFLSIWVSNDHLVNDVRIGKSKSAPGFEIFALVPFFVSIIALRRRKKSKSLH